MKALFLLLLCLPLSLWAQPKIPARPEPATYINDYAKLLPEEERQALEIMLDAHFQAGGPQIVLVSLSSLGDYSEMEIAQAIFDKWGIGRKEKNDGVLILIALKQKRFRIHTGYGMEGILSDAQASRLLDKHLRPAFQQGNYAQGIKGLLLDLKRLQTEDQAQASAPSIIGKPWAMLGLIGLIGVLISLAHWLKLWEKAGKITPALRYSLYVSPLVLLLFCWLTPRYGFRFILFVLVPLQGLSFGISNLKQARWQWQGYLTLGHYGLLFWSLHNLPDLPARLTEGQPWYAQALLLSTALLLVVELWNYLGARRLLQDFEQQYGLPKGDLNFMLIFYALGGLSLLLALGAGQGREVEQGFKALGFWTIRHEAYQNLSILSILAFVSPHYLWALRRRGMLPYPLLEDAILGTYPPSYWAQNLGHLDANWNGKSSNWWADQHQRFKGEGLKEGLEQAWADFRAAAWDQEAQKALWQRLEQMKAAPEQHFEILPKVALLDQRIQLEQFCLSPDLPPAVKTQLEQAFEADLAAIDASAMPQSILQKWTELLSPFETGKKSDHFFAYTLVAKVCSTGFEQQLWQRFQRKPSAVQALEALRRAFSNLDIWDRAESLSLASLALDWYEGRAAELVLREDLALKELYDYAAAQWAQPYRLEEPRKALSAEIELAYQALLPYFDSDGYVAADKRPAYLGLLSRLQEIKAKLNEVLPYDFAYLIREIQRRQEASTWGLNLEEYLSSSIRDLEQRILSEIKALERDNWPKEAVVRYYFKIINYPFQAYLKTKPRPSVSSSSSSASRGSKSNWTYSSSSSSSASSSSSSSSSRSRSSFGGGSSGGGGASGGW
jgi:uncharacterized protein